MLPQLIKMILDAIQAFLNKQAGSPPEQPSAPSPQPNQPVDAPTQPVAPSHPVVQVPAVQPESSQSGFNFVSSNTTPLTEEDYQNAANLLGAEVAAVRAVATVESSGKGFLASGRPPILLEAQHFSRATNHRYDSSNPNISSPTWNKALYRGGEKEYDRLEEAIALDEVAALSSASWGLFQILGSNCKACGYNTVQDFVKANVESQGKQLECFVNFLKANKLDQHLRDKNWSSLAQGYNGSQYKLNNYDVKLEQTYNKFKT